MPVRQTRENMFMRAVFLFLFLFLFLFHSLPFCTCRDTITATQPLQITESLLSKENNFELCFFNPGNSTNWYVGIRYAKLPEKAIVWVANRDYPINDTSSVSLAINGFGNLALYADNNTKFPIWSTSVSNQATNSDSTVSAQLLDSGNLVLIHNNDEKPLWQSFDYPTDTYLPGMKLGYSWRTGLKWSLSSWKTETDPGTGEYSYRINLAGSPQFFLYNMSAPVWRSNAWPWSSQPSNLSVYLNTYSYVNNQDEIYYMFFPNDPSKMTRMVVDKSGTLQLLTWNLNNDNRWDKSWFTPKYQCDLYGQCGSNSKCNPDNINRFECECLPGFEPSSPGQWNQQNGHGGCVRKHVQPLSRCQNGDGFVTVARVNPPDTSNAAMWWGASEKECEKVCRNNCSCTAFMKVSRNGSGKFGCFMWYGKLINIVQFTDDGLFLHVRIHAIGDGNSTTGFLKRKRIPALIITSIISTLFCCLTFAYCWLKRKRKSEYEHGESRSEPELPIFHLSTIMAATENFSPANKLGQGGFGYVYKGQLLNGQNIAVKRLSKSSRQGVEEFKNEIMLIAKLQHRNLVKLLGCCVEGEETMLIYEYMPNKSLDSFIFDEFRRSCLDWRRRFDIIIGVARGVLYLHQDSRLRIIHRDLKASNVLLDAKMSPKISDFGMARIFMGDQVQDKTNRVVGTYGYMSPEYAVFGKFSIKSDVFSFGVILLEIISGVRNNNCYQEDNSINLIGHVWQLWREDRTLEIVDLTLQSYNLDEALRCIQIGLLCVQDEARDRPTMSAVVLMLSSEIVIASPKRPAYMFRTSHEDNTTKIEEQGLCSINQSAITKVIPR